MVEILLFIIKFIVALGVVLVFLVIGSTVTSLTAKPIRRAMIKKFGWSLLNDGGDLVQFVTILGFMVFATVGIYTGLFVLGVRVTSLLGTVSFALGFVSQRVIRDYLIGLWLNMTPWLAVGVFVVLTDGETSYAFTIQSLDRQSATVKQIDGAVIRMPYTYMFRNSIFVYDSHARMSFRLPLAYTVDATQIDEVYRASFEQMAYADLFEQEYCRRQIVGFGRSYIELELLPYLDRTALKASGVWFIDLKDDVTQAFARTFAQHYGLRGITSSSCRVVSI